jgi:hypothetical protein
MVIMGMIIGALTFSRFNSTLAYYKYGFCVENAVGNGHWFTLISSSSSLDIRGWAEMHPLNGPGWSLFYEYIANILYALLLENFQKTALACLYFLLPVH